MSIRYNPQGSWLQFGRRFTHNAIDRTSIAVPLHGHFMEREVSAP